MLLIKVKFSLVVLLAALRCFGQQEDAFVNEINQTLNAPTIENQIPVFQKIGTFYGMTSEKVPPPVQVAIINFMSETSKGKGPSPKVERPFSLHGSASFTADIPLGISLMLIDYRTTGAAEAIADVAKATQFPRSVRDRCVGIMRRNSDDKHLLEVASSLNISDSVPDRQVSLLAYASMRKPSQEGISRILNEFKTPTLKVDENIIALMSRANMSEEAVYLAVNIMKTKPETARSLMIPVSDAKPGILKRHEAEFKDISAKSDNLRVKELVRNALSRTPK